MNKKLKRLIEDEESTMAKIEELQAHLKEVRMARKQEEDQEIVRSVRARKLGARALLDLLEGIQEGRVVIEPAADPESDETATDKDQTEKRKGQKNTGAEDAPESEENHE